MNVIDRIAKLDRLSSLDASFLSLATPQTPMHVATVTYIEPAQMRDSSGRIRLAELRRLVDERISLAPRFRQRPIEAPFGIGKPVWVDDPDFDVANHVNETVLPPPGSEAQLRELCAQLMMRTLEPSRPLWEVWAVDGYADGYVVLIEKVHHVMMDGVSGVDVVMLMTDPTSKVESFPQTEHTTSKPGQGTLLAAGVLDELGVPLGMLGAPARVTRLLANTARQPQQASELVKEVESLGRGALSLLARSTVAPRTPLNQAVGSHRIFEHAEWPLGDMKRIGKTFGCTVNDVALAAVTSGIRQLLLDREEDPGTTFQVLVPVSTRGVAAHVTLGNQVAAFLVPLPVGVADARSELERIHEITQHRKSDGQASVVAALFRASDRWPRPVIDILAHLTHHQPFANAVVTNVPGPQTERYVLGARISRIVPVVPLAGNLDVSIGIFSYNGEVSFGCFADSDRCNDLHVLTDGIRASLESLGLAAERALKEKAGLKKARN